MQHKATVIFPQNSGHTERFDIMICKPILILYNPYISREADVKKR